MRQRHPNRRNEGVSEPVPDKRLEDDSRTDLRSQLLTDREVAIRWKISPKTLQNWRVSGHGPVHIKINGAVRYRMQDLEAFEAANARRSTSKVISNEK